MRTQRVLACLTATQLTILDLPVAADAALVTESRRSKNGRDIDLDDWFASPVRIAGLVVLVLLVVAWVVFCEMNRRRDRA